VARSTSAGPGIRKDEKPPVPTPDGPHPAITTQPTFRGQAGDPIGIVIAEVICRENEENDLFAGLAAFVRAELPAGKAITDKALDKLLDELRRKGRRLGADAILSTNIRTLRGADATGRKLLKMIATGTAVVLRASDDR
jgi:uncharacterized protein YbjQ (UPF0145 family)